jgi:copper chaperone NosL
MNKLKTSSRSLLILCGLALLVVLFVPMWRIDLDAPQYPEGLMLQIYAHKLAGNVDIINGLNHYIGMKTLHADDFPEFRILPGIIVFFSLLSFIVAVAGKRKWLNLLLTLFILFGVIAMIDFWRWEYQYGHDLNPDAAIRIPGMAYQPPLIGFKQLLNFGAYSIPDIGGWIFVGVGAILLLLVILETRRAKLSRNLTGVAGMLVLAVSMTSLTGCSTAPEAIRYGKDNCYSCKMTITDNRFGAELVTKKGKTYKFDDAHCILSFLHADAVDKKEIAAVYFTDFTGDHQLVNATEAFFLQSELFQSPMNGNLAAFRVEDSMKKMEIQYTAARINWDQLNK